MRIGIWTIVLCMFSVAQAQVRTAPRVTPRTALSAAVSNSVTGPSVSLNCAEPAGGAIVTGNNFYRGTTNGGPYTLVGSATSCAYTDATVLFATTYYYVATAVNGSSSCPSGQTCESPYSNQATAAVGTSPIPGAPTGLTVSSIVATNILLEWQKPAAQAGVLVESYSIWRCAKSSCPAPPKIATVPATLAAYLDAGCIPAKASNSRTCYYEVKANDLIAGKMKTSAPSNIVEAVVR